MQEPLENKISEVRIRILELLIKNNIQIKFSNFVNRHNQRVMNKEEHKKLQKAFREYAKKVLASKEESQKFLIEAGIHNKKGELSKHYAH